MKIIFYFLPLIFLYSCKTPRYIYSASAPNNPYFTGKGQTRINGYYAAGGDNNNTGGEKNQGYDLQAAHSIASNWALTASYFNRKEKDIYPYASHNYFDSSVVNYSRNLVEFGGGYFLILGRNRYSYSSDEPAITFNIYGGLGFGTFRINDAGKDTAGLGYSRYHASRIFKWYLQPSINFITGKYFRISLVDRFSLVHYGGITTSYSPDELRYFDLDKLAGRTVGFLESSVAMQLGIPGADWIKVDGGATMVTRPGLPNAPNLKSRWLTGFIGLSFEFPANKKAPPK
jgi:hypothetical protein